ARRKAEEEAKRKYEQMIHDLCSGAEGNIISAEQQRDIIVEVAKSIKEVPPHVRGAWDSMGVVYEDLDTANSAVDAARAFQNPQANVNNANYYVQDSRKEMFGVAQALQMSVKDLFGFVPPPRWNGVMPGEKPIPKPDPRGVTPSNNPGGHSWFNIGFPGFPGAGAGTQAGGEIGKGGVTGGGPNVNRTSGQTAVTGGGGGLPERGAIPLVLGGERQAAQAGGGAVGTPLHASGGSSGSSGFGMVPLRGAPLTRKGAQEEEAAKERGGKPIPGWGGVSSGDGPESFQTAQAWKLNAKGDYAGAELAAREAVRQNPNDHRAYEALAWAELRQGRYKDAEADASNAIALNSRSARAYRIRAFARQMLGDRKGMIADIEMAAKLNPDYADEAEIARRGGDIYDPSKGDEDLWAPRRLKRFPLGAAAAGALLLLAGGGAAFALRRSRRKLLEGSGPAAAQPPSARAPSMPTALESYVLGEKLNSARGEVRLAQDRALGRAVIVRRISAPDPLERQRLLAASRQAAQFSHPGSVAIYEAVEDGDSVVLVCERVAGRTVREAIARVKAFKTDNVIRVVSAVAQTLEAAHAAGFVHGRVHLGNIFITEGGEVKVADFGMAGPNASPEKDVKDLGLSLAGLAAASGESVPPKLRDIISRSAQGGAPPIKTASEFLAELKG
ncbi:MAG TPA: hypothetical protein DCM05_07310, partial [Elusimicrobia bacterium]|nr:hypothetical protein [Elusimicrobiota bacterium]